MDLEDVEVEPLSVMRKHTCTDGSGTFTAFLPTIRNEHSGNAEWKLLEGTRRYETLRGTGTHTGHLLAAN
jgi:hypothetical protein